MVRERADNAEVLFVLAAALFAMGLYIHRYWSDLYFKRGQPRPDDTVRDGWDLLTKLVRPSVMFAVGTIFLVVGVAHLFD